MNHLKDFGFYPGDTGNHYRALNRGGIQLEFYFRRITLTAKGDKGGSRDELGDYNSGEMMVAWTKVVVG